MRTLVAAVALLATTQASGTPPHVSDRMLVDEHGMTLYVFAGSRPPDATACEGNCDLNFPPALADANDTPADGFTLIKNQKGERQWAYKGRPLYHGRMDKKPGDHQGDGLNGVWYPIRP